MSPARIPGKDELFESFFRAHIPKIRGYVRTLVPDAEVESVVSATFATAWQKFHDMPAGLEQAWLFGVARGHVRNAVRAHVRRQAVEARFRSLRHHVAADLHHDTHDPAQIDAMVRALDALSVEDQEVLQLSLWHELQPIEIAEVLHVRPDAARARLARARKRLLATLAQQATAEEEVS